MLSEIRRDIDLLCTCSVHHDMVETSTLMTSASHFKRWGKSMRNASGSKSEKKDGQRGGCSDNSKPPAKGIGGVGVWEGGGGSQVMSVKEIRVRWLQCTLDHKWLMRWTHTQFDSNCVSFAFTDSCSCLQSFWISARYGAFKGCLSSEYPERDIFHSKSLRRGTSSVLCGHASSRMNPVVLTLLTPSHVQKGRHGVWFLSPLTYDPTKDHSWDFVALYLKAFNSQECTV